MKLQPETERILDRWLGMDTWHTNHPLDMNRWYDFIVQYRKDHGFSLNEDSIRELIESKLDEIGTKIRDNEDLSRIIRERISLAYHILDFLKHTEQ